jgi:hypothetical protein
MSNQQESAVVARRVPKKRKFDPTEYEQSADRKSPRHYNHSSQVPAAAGPSSVISSSVVVATIPAALTEAKNHPLRSKRRKDDLLNDPKLSMSPVVRLHQMNHQVKPVRRGRGCQSKEVVPEPVEKVKKNKKTRRGRAAKNLKFISIGDLRFKMTVTSDGDKNQVSDKQQQECGHGLMPYTASNVIDLIKVGSTATFVVFASEQKFEFRGSFVLPDSDETIFADFNSFAKTIVATPNFKPIVGSIVAALSSTKSLWMRGYVTKVLESSYHVYFVDYGNIDDSVVAVKPIPVSYQHETMSVRLSFFGYLTSTTKDFVNQNMVVFKSHQLVITKKKDDGSFLAKFTGENVPTCFVKIESWEKTLTVTNVSPPPPPPVETPVAPTPPSPVLFSKRLAEEAVAKRNSRLMLSQMSTEASTPPSNDAATPLRKTISTTSNNGVAASTKPGAKKKRATTPHQLTTQNGINGPPKVEN